MSGASSSNGRLYGVGLGPGDPDTDPTADLGRLGNVASESALLDIYFVYTAVKPPE